MDDLKIVPLERHLVAPVAKTFREVFEASPWYEMYACKNCGTAYGRPEDFVNRPEGMDSIDAAFLPESCVKTCNQPLETVCFYDQIIIDKQDNKITLDKSIFLQALDEDDFIGFGIFAEKKLIGFAWGFKMPQQDTPSVSDISWSREQLAARGAPLPTTFYTAEVGVLPKYRNGGGIGSLLVHAHLCEARERGYSHVTFRTAHEGLIYTFKSLWREESRCFEPLFQDSEPAKSDHIWYLAPLAPMQEPKKRKKKGLNISTTQ